MPKEWLYLIQRQKFLNENATYNKDGFNEEAVLENI